MNKTGRIRRSIRFRKWSRKAFAVFASLGKLVTIGCLPKDVADSSLSKKKSGAQVKCKSNGRSPKEANDAGCQEADIYASPGCGSGLAAINVSIGFVGLQPALCILNINPQTGIHVSIARNQEDEISIINIRNSIITQMTQAKQTVKKQYLFQLASSAFLLFHHSKKILLRFRFRETPFSIFIKQHQ